MEINVVKAELLPSGTASLWPHSARSAQALYKSVEAAGVGGTTAPPRVGVCGVPHSSSPQPGGMQVTLAPEIRLLIVLQAGGLDWHLQEAATSHYTIP